MLIAVIKLTLSCFLPRILKLSTNVSRQIAAFGLWVNLYLGNEQVTTRSEGAGEGEAVMREVALLADMQHPNIVQYRESFRQPAAVCIVMEFCQGGDLFTFIASQRGRHLKVCIYI